VPDSRRPPRFPIAFEEGVAAIAMALLVLITLANVAVRYFTDHSFAWTEEFSVFLLVVMALAGTAAAAARDRHIRVEYFYAGGSGRRQRRLALVSAIVSAGFFLLMAVLLGRFAWDEYRYGETTMAIGVPRWWYSVWLPPLCAAIAWRALQAGVRIARQPGPPASEETVAAP
jgi:TRAP-type C4-dicarboxylate transport system permease small subunit